MEVIIIGLIIYVISSVINEVAKKNKNAPNAPSTRTGGGSGENTGGGGKVIPFPSDPNTRRKTFQDLLREALEEASMESMEGKDLGEDSEGHSVGEYQFGDRHEGEGSGSSEFFGKSTNTAGEYDTWPPQREGSLTGEEMMDPLSQGSEGLSHEGFDSENLSFEGLSSEGHSSSEGDLATDSSLGGDTPWGSLGQVLEDEHSSGSLLKRSANSDDFSSLEQEDAEDFADIYDDTSDLSNFDAVPMFSGRGLLSSEGDLLRGIIVSEVLNPPGGKNRRMGGRMAGRIGAMRR